ncbi:hypothetical protein WA026_000500 [Henosepilachna vigintioctopunctata]|uniref:UBA domain-containing protein n=1 Tax=Henosepilachna vigintioctopunctata TaxID=420089 RepID=A0AAW1V677_9CUCU
MTMRAPALSEPKSTFPTYKVPQSSAMRGRAPPVQVARAAWGGRANPPSPPAPASTLGDPSVIPGSSCSPSEGRNSNIRMQSVTANCLLNSVTVPKIQRIDLKLVAHNNSSKLDNKFGALPLGRDIPNKKSDDLEVLDLNDLHKDLNQSCDNNDNGRTESPSEKKRPCHTLFQRTNDFDPSIYAGPLRLRGGGESSLSTGTSGWGTPNAQQASNNNANSSSGWGTANPANQNSAGTQQWNTNANRPPTSNQGPTSQDANKTNSNITPNGQQPATSQPNTPGWGQPGSKPQPTNNMPPTTSANNSVISQHNNGPLATTNSTTKQQLEQLSNMREAIFSQDGWGGQHVNQDTNWDIPGSPEPSNKADGSGNAPWKPSVNNGTELWEANLRNGGQPPPQPQQKTPWGHTPSTNIGGTWGEDDETDSSNVWTGVPSTQPQWGGNSANGAAMWGGPKKENEWGNVGGNTGGGWGGDPRAGDPRTAAIDPRDIRPDLRDMRTSASDSMRLLDPREQLRIPGSDMRGDPRGITGRLNGAGAEAFWNQAGPHTGAQHMHHQNKMGPTTNAGWEEPSPPSQRRNMPNYDDGTSLWGNPQQGSHWKDLPTGAGMGRGNVSGPPGMAQPRIALQLRNGSWDEGKWEDHPKWQKPKMPVGGGPLWDNEADWGHKLGGPNKQQQFTKEMVWNSKQFRCLVDMGFKKEDVENALRLRDMNFEEALDMLSPLRNQEAWRRGDDDHFDHQPFPGQGRFASGPAGQMSFPPSNSAPNMLNNMNSAGGANNSLINSISPAIVQKMLTQGAGGHSFAVGSSGGGRGNIQPQSQPSTHQLRTLVQQIQMAVQAGYLNHQILNQPLAPQTLVLLSQLLQQIKALQQLANQQSMAQSQCINGKPNSNAILQCSVLITKTKQQITNLQNQIAAQQAIYVKQQHQGGLGGGGPNDFLKNTGMHDSLNAMQSNFADLGIKEAQISQQQSRLNQWIKPDKEEGGEFSRAPGSSIATSPNMNPLGLTQPDGPWSSGRSADTGWPDPAVSDVSNEKDASQWPTSAQPSLTDLVPEFEPGKPWKGTQMKTVEDDPSITPGSVVRSPLSIATIKDNELFSMNPSKSPPTGEVGSLSSSTWSFNPPTSTTSAFTSPQSKLPNKGLENQTTAVTSELWGAPKPRGPPPGLSSKAGSLVNGWSSSIGSPAPWGNAPQRTSNWIAATQWLLLRNLTAQV